MLLVSSHEMRLMDRFSIESFGIPERVLMENAGRAAAHYFLELFPGKISGYVAIFAGHGNNGGDAFVIARYLSQRKIPVTVFLLSEKSKVQSGAAAANLNLIVSLGIPVLEVSNISTFNSLKYELEDSSILIDAILGTGLRSDVEGFLSDVINFINGMNRPILSIDIPSGLSSDTGQICGVCIHAFATITFAFAKMGHFLYPGRTYVGKLKIVDIGIPLLVAKKVGCAQHLLELDYVLDSYLYRKGDAHKGTTGHLVVVAGSRGKTGAAVMTSLGAMRSGAGLVTLCIPESLNNVVEPMVVEAITVGLPDNVSNDLDRSAFEVLIGLLPGKRGVVFGPGIGTGPGVSYLLEQLLLNCSVPLVIDADGLNIIADNISMLKTKKVSVVLTPHPGEMARLIGKSIMHVQRNRVLVARNFAKKFDVHVVLKGAGTVIAHPNGKIFINSTGNSGMASGGMGDVLTGLVASFITQGYPISFAAELAVYIHGLAGDAMVSLKGPYGYLATDIINCLPEQIALLHSNKSELSEQNINSLIYRIDN